MKIKTRLTHRASKTVDYGVKVGKITFDKNCESEIEDSKLEDLKKVDFSIFEDLHIESESVETDNTDNEVDLSTMTVNDLHEIATESNLPKEEWEKLKKADLIDYIDKKL